MTGIPDGTARDERGSVSIVTAGVAVVALVLCMGAADVARVLVASGRAQAAADAAALAAAQDMATAGQDPMGAAADYAARNEATMTDCRCDPGSLEATVTVRVAVGPLLLFSDGLVVTGSARAVVDGAG